MKDHAKVPEGRTNAFEAQCHLKFTLTKDLS